MTTDFQHLLALGDERRAACRDPEVDAIVLDQLKTRMLTALLQATDALNQIDHRKRPALSAQIDAELAWLRAVVAVFGEPDA
jgi:hypothetical protein